MYHTPGTVPLRGAHWLLDILMSSDDDISAERICYVWKRFMMLLFFCFDNEKRSATRDL